MRPTRDPVVCVWLVPVILQAAQPQIDLFPPPDGLAVDPVGLLVSFEHSIRADTSAATFDFPLAKNRNSMCTEEMLRFQEHLAM